MSFLQLQKVTKKFGGLVATSNVSFSVEQGQIIGIVGPNGAGKTTLFNVISGFYKVTSGKIFLKGAEITNHPSYELCRKGIGRTFQIPMSMDTMSVLDNVTVGAMIHKPDTIEARNYAVKTLKFVGLADYKDKLAGSLSVIQKKRLEIARALSTAPELLLLDECMAGLHGSEREEAIELIKKINASGITILAIEHVMPVVMSVCHRVVVLQYGEMIAEGTPEEITQDKRVISAYLGE